MESKMKGLAALLGVEIGEEFGATGSDANYKITDSGVFEKARSGKWVETLGYMLYGLLTGTRKIIKKPWKPKKGEQYWCATTYCGAPQYEWQDRVSDLAFYAVGNCFRTEEEAEAHKEEVLSRLEKIYDEGKPLIGADE